MQQLSFIQANYFPHKPLNTVLLIKSSRDLLIVPGDDNLSIEELKREGGGVAVFTSFFSYGYG